MKKAFLLLALFPSLCFAFERFTDFPPHAPFSDDRWAAENYRNEVERFVEAAKDYVERMNSEIESIRREQEEAVDAANRAVEEFNDWVAQRRSRY